MTDNTPQNEMTNGQKKDFNIRHMYAMGFHKESRMKIIRLQHRRTRRRKSLKTKNRTRTRFCRKRNPKKNETDKKNIKCREPKNDAKHHQHLHSQPKRRTKIIVLPRPPRKIYKNDSQKIRNSQK